MGGNEIRELSHASFKSMVFSPCLMKTILTAGGAQQSLRLLQSLAGHLAWRRQALAQTNTTDTETSGMSMDMGGDMMAMIREMSANHKWGMISSISNDEQGQPAWIISGNWMMEMASQNRYCHS